MKLLIYSQTSTVQPFKFGSGEVISAHILVGNTILDHSDALEELPVLAALTIYIFILALSTPGVSGVGKRLLQSDTRNIEVLEFDANCGLTLIHQGQNNRKNTSATSGQHRFCFLYI